MALWEIEKQLGLDPNGYITNEEWGGIWKPFDWIFQRPSLALSESIGAARAGEDVWDALTRGLKGYRKYDWLGHQVFPEAKEPGFQPADVGAFLVDAVADPTNLLPFGALLKAPKPLAKGLAKFAKWVTPEMKAVLGAIPEAEFAIKPSLKAKLALGDIEALGFKGPADAAKHIMATVKDSVPFFPEDLSKPLESWGHPALDALRTYMRMIDANIQPTPQTALQSAAQRFAQRVLPVGFTLKNFSHSGKEIAERWQRAALRIREGSEDLINQLEFLRGTPEAKRKEMVRVLEGLTADEVDQTVVDGAVRLDNALKSHGRNIERFRDEWNKPLEVFDTDLNRWEPFKVIPNYYPHRWNPEDLTKSSLNKMKDEMRARGASENQIQAIIRNMGLKPKRVGNLEIKRHPFAIGYEMDPLKVLPKYFQDSLMRLELAREFGVDGRRLDMLMSNLKREGFDAAWADQIGSMLVGNNIHEKALLEKVTPTLASVQAVSKLGFATSTANLSQGPINQYVLSGNFINSLLKGGVPVPGGGLFGGDLNSARIGAAAFGRATRDDLYRAGIGGRSRLMDFYMKIIGFNWTERMGRHVGAMGGELDASALYEAAKRASQAGDTKKASRFMSELERKYRIRMDDQYDSYRLFSDISQNGPTNMSVGTMAGQLGRLPSKVLEHAGIIGADTTMHAFGPMDLPVAWRSPNIKLLMQFKSFIYKQMGFTYSQVFAPGIQYLATDGAKGSLGPMLRFAVAMPAGAEAVAHMRDVAKSLPSHAYELGKGALKGEFNLADWEYKDPFWEDPAPIVRLFQDMSYVGTFGIAGDVIEAANRGRTLRYMAGPTVTDLVDYFEAMMGEMDIGKQVTRQLPGFLGLPYSANIFD